MASNKILYVDSREPENVRSKIRKELNERNVPVTVMEEELDTGDFVFGDIVIERKEASDFVSSITDGRLSEQSSKMSVDFGEHKYVIVEGDPYGVVHSNIHDNSIVGMFCSLGFKKDVKVVPVKTLSHTLFAVARIVEYSLDDESFDPAEFALSRTEADKEDVTVSMIACIEGISVDRARDVIEHIGADSVQDVAESDVDTLQEIEGVGEKRANKILDSVR